MPSFNAFRVHQGENRAIALIGSFDSYSEAMLAGMDSGVPAYDVSTDDFETYNRPDVAAARARANWEGAREAAWQQEQLPELFRR